MKEIQKGDEIRGYGAWKEDLYASGELLSSKRFKRGWDPDVFKKQVLDKYCNHHHHQDDKNCHNVRDVLEKVMFWNDRTSGGRLTEEDVPW